MTKTKTRSLLLTTLVDANRPISTKQVAGFSGVCWKTARDNLEDLFRVGIVKKGTVGNNKRIYWTLSVPIGWRK